MAVDPLSPLTEQHYQMLKGCRQYCAGTKQLLEKMRQANLPHEEAEQTVAVQDDMARRLLEVFFPGQP